MKHRVGPKLSDLLGQNSTELTISIVILTRNEVEKIGELLSRISRSIEGIPAEGTLADDITDSTPEAIRSLEKQVYLLTRAPLPGLGVLQLAEMCMKTAQIILSTL